MLPSLYIYYKDISKEEYENAETYKNEDDKYIDQYDFFFIAVVWIRDSLRSWDKLQIEKAPKGLDIKKEKESILSQQEKYIIIPYHIDY